MINASTLERDGCVALRVRAPSRPNLDVGFHPRMAMVFLGVLVSSGALAYGIIALLPVELILQVGSSAGFAMVFALLIGAIVWNLGTWYLGLPASSSHTLIGSIIGVGLANQMMATSSGTGGGASRNSAPARSTSSAPRVRSTPRRAASARRTGSGSSNCRSPSTASSSW